MRGCESAENPSRKGSVGKCRHCVVQPRILNYTSTILLNTVTLKAPLVSSTACLGWLNPQDDHAYNIKNKVKRALHKPNKPPLYPPSQEVYWKIDLLVSTSSHIPKNESFVLPSRMNKMSQPKPLNHAAILGCLCQLAHTHYTSLRTYNSPSLIPMPPL